MLNERFNSNARQYIKYKWLNALFALYFIRHWNNHPHCIPNTHFKHEFLFLDVQIPAWWIELCNQIADRLHSNRAAECKIKSTRKTMDYLMASERRPPRTSGRHSRMVNWTDSAACTWCNADGRKRLSALCVLFCPIVLARGAFHRRRRPAAAPLAGNGKKIIWFFCGWPCLAIQMKLQSRPLAAPFQDLGQQNQRCSRVMYIGERVKEEIWTCSLLARLLYTSRSLTHSLGRFLVLSKESES